MGSSADGSAGGGELERAESVALNEAELCAVYVPALPGGAGLGSLALAALVGLSVELDQLLIIGLGLSSGEVDGDHAHFAAAVVCRAGLRLLAEKLDAVDAPYQGLAVSGDVFLSSAQRVLGS